MGWLFESSSSEKQKKSLRRQALAAINHMTLSYQHVTTAFRAATCAPQFLSKRTRRTSTFRTASIAAQPARSGPSKTQDRCHTSSFIMFVRSAFRKALALPFEQTPSTTVFRACLTTTTPKSTSTATTTHSPTPEAPLSATPRAQFTEPAHQQSHPSTSSTSTPPQTRNHVPSSKQPVAPTFDSPLQVTKSLLDKLPHLTAQRSHYIAAHLHAKPYLVTAGDHVRLPFLMPNVQPGDVIRLNRATVLGSRDFTLKGTPYVDERMFECRARVMGVDAEPMRIKEKTKRRQRHVKTVRSKHRYTLLRIMDVKVKSVEELLQDGAVVVEGGEQQPQLEVKS